MGKRGPKSAAEKEAACLISGEFRKPPKPPGDLNEGQKSIWQLIVNRLPADWFAFENYPLLVQYCRHISRARLVSQMLDDMKKEKFIIKDYRDLLRSEEEQSRILSSLATKMRLTQQSAYDKSKKKPPEDGPKPWERGG